MAGFVLSGYLATAAELNELRRLGIAGPLGVVAIITPGTASRAAGGMQQLPIGEAADGRPRDEPRTVIVAPRFPDAPLELDVAFSTPGLYVKRDQGWTTIPADLKATRKVRIAPVANAPGNVPGRAVAPLRAAHRVDLRGALRQRTRRPALAAVVAAEDLAAAGRAVHVPGLARVEGEREHRGARLHAHVDLCPAGAAVLAAEQHADLALEIRARGHPDRLRVAGSLADVAAIGLPVGVQGLEPRAGPVLAAVGARDPARAAHREDLAGSPP